MQRVTIQAYSSPVTSGQKEIIIYQKRTHFLHKIRSSTVSSCCGFHTSSLVPSTATLEPVRSMSSVPLSEELLVMMTSLESYRLSYGLLP